MSCIVLYRAVLVGLLIVVQSQAPRYNPIIPKTELVATPEPVHYDDIHSMSVYWSCWLSNQTVYLGQGLE
jgi:hypothetical protein